MSINYKSTTDIVNLGSDKGGNLTYKELKRECVARGMPFDDVIGGDFPNLSHWLLNNMLKPKDDQNIIDFDNYTDKILISRGKGDLVHRSLRLSYLGPELDNEGEIIEKKPKVIKEKKAPRERTETGLFKGTKKAYVQELQSKGKTIEQVIIKVTRKFPDAKEKSIKIWFNKFKKANKK